MSSPKHPNAERWGGPGSSHANRLKPKPEKWEWGRPGEPTNPPTSLVSGGGGERDLRHSHDNRYRSSKASHDREHSATAPSRKQRDKRH